MMRIRSTWSLALVCAVGASVIAGCAGAPEPRREASPSVGAGPFSDEPSVQNVGSPMGNRPDATVVLRSSGCELDGDGHSIDPGVLTIEFVNESYREGYIKVVQVPPGRELGDLRAGIGMAGGWGDYNEPSTSDIWSSPRAVISGRWAVACFKDTVYSPHGINIVRAGAVGPIEVR